MVDFRSRGLRSAALALGALLALAGLATLRGSLHPRVPSAPAEPPRPNIILILTDDLDVGSMALLQRLTELLGDPGTRFDNMFVTDSLCCPSRASILTGQYAHSHGILSNNPPLGGFPKFRAAGAEGSTIATWLRAAGYHTALLGKYLNAYPEENQHTYVPPGWDEWGAVFSSRGSDDYFDYEINWNGETREYGSRPEEYETDVLTQGAVDIVRRAASGARPLFLYIATAAPHIAAVPAPRHESAFPDVHAPRGPSFGLKGTAGQPRWIREQDPLSERDVRKLDKLYRRRLQTMLAVEDMVSRLLAELAKAGQLDRTYIFFTSDNGFFFGEHRFPHGKGTPYEESARVPLIVRGPRVPPGGHRPHLVLNIDLAPTFAELGGARVPEWVEGRSLVPLLGPDPAEVSSWRSDFVIEHWADPVEVEGGGFPGFRALRTRDTLYAEYSTGERELYDLRRDPYELESLQGRADPQLLKGLSERLHVLAACRGASCR